MIRQLCRAAVAACCLFVSAPVPAQKLSALPTASALAGSESIPAAQGAGCSTQTSPCTTVRTTPAQIGTYLAGTYQPLDSDLTAIAALSTQPFGRGVLAYPDAATARAGLGLGTLATQSGTFSGTSSGTNTGDQTTISGNAGTATVLQTARTINGVAFDGSANINVPAVDTVTARLASNANLSDLGSAAAARGNMGVAIGVDVQAPKNPGWKSGRWYSAVEIAIANGAPIATNSLLLYPFFLERAVTITDLGVRVNTVAAGGHLQLAIYANSAANLPTGAPLAATAATISTATAGVVSGGGLTGGAATLPAGWYWAAACVDVAAGFMQHGVTTGALGHTFGSSTLANLMYGTNTMGTGYTVAQTFGTMPNLTSASLTEATLAMGAPVLAFLTQ